MKNTFLLFIMTLLFSTVQSQENNAPKPVKFKLGVVYSPDYTYRLIRVNSEYKPIKEYQNNTELPVLGYTTGINVTRYFNKHIGLETGIYYTKKGFRTKTRDFIYFDIMPNDPTLPRSFSYIDTYNYLEIPVKFNYTISKKRMSYFINAGLGAEIFLKMQEKFTTNYDDYSETENRYYSYQYSDVCLSTTVEVGVAYTICSHMAISLQPAYTQFIRSTSPNSGMENLPYSLGCKVGVYYQFY